MSFVAVQYEHHTEICHYNQEYKFNNYQLQHAVEYIFEYLLILNKEKSKRYRFSRYRMETYGRLLPLHHIAL